MSLQTTGGAGSGEIVVRAERTCADGREGGGRTQPARQARNEGGGGACRGHQGRSFEQCDPLASMVDPGPLLIAPWRSAGQLAIGECGRASTDRSRDDPPANAHRDTPLCPYL
jgi:hypothetical protein